jgi:hypothetical protein
MIEAGGREFTIVSFQVLYKARTILTELLYSVSRDKYAYAA